MCFTMFYLSVAYNFILIVSSAKQNLKRSINSKVQLLNAYLLILMEEFLSILAYDFSLQQVFYGLWEGNVDCTAHAGNALISEKVCGVLNVFSDSYK